MNLVDWFMELGQGTLLHGQVGLDVVVRGGWTFMAKPERDDVDVNPRPAKKWVS